MAPAQLGKTIVSRYRKPAAAGWDCFSELDLSADTSIQGKASLLRFGAEYLWVDAWHQSCSCQRRARQHEIRV